MSTNKIGAIWMDIIYNKNRIINQRINNKIIDNKRRV